MAWWARGMHELSLGRGADSVTSFERSLAYAREAAGEAAYAAGRADAPGATHHRGDGVRRLGGDVAAR